MPTNSGQGNVLTSVTYPANSLLNVDVYTSVLIPVIGTVLYSNAALTSTMPAGTYRLDLGTGEKKLYTVNSLGVITAISQCSWSATSIYAPLFTSTKNNCVAGSCTVLGSTVTLNDGTPSNDYAGASTYTSFISQSDADSQALAAAMAMFDAGKQAAVNSRGFCTFTFSSGTGTYSANFTKNNCASNCYPNGTVSYSITKTGYSAQSTVSCSDAQSQANAAAYNAAVAEVNAGGQAYANANGSCCCWVPSPACFNCFRYGVREVDTCTGLYRNDYVTATNSCECGQGCAGTNYDYFECVNTFQQDKLKRERYNCAPYNFTGNTIYETCGCTNNQPDIRDIYEQTCIDCEPWFILRDFAVCSPTAGNYFAKGVNYGLNKPSTAPCSTGVYDIPLGIRCVSETYINPTTVDVTGNSSPCGKRYRYWDGGFYNYGDSAGYAGACV